MTRPLPNARFLEIDLLRGLAVLLMVIYHALFDLAFFYGWNVDLDSGPAWLIGRGAAVLFVSLAGLSMTLAWRRKHEGARLPFMKRGLQLLGLGFLLTIFTWIFFPTYVIWFGVLHLIGAGLIGGIIFLERPRAAGIGGAFITISGIYFSQTGIQAHLPMIIPIFPVSIQTFDYFPLFPWVGVFLLGIAAGNELYPKGNPRIRFDWKLPASIRNTIRWLGQNSLTIYFAHQPIIVGILLGIQFFMR